MTSVTLVEFALKLLRRLGVEENGGIVDCSVLRDGSLLLRKAETQRAQP